MKLSETLGQLAGAASLSWRPKPAGVFDPTTAQKYVEEAITVITAEIKAAIPEKRGAEATLNVAEDLKANYNFGYNTAIDELTASLEERLGVRLAHKNTEESEKSR
jgi:hypothetical protein